MTKETHNIVKLNFIPGSPDYIRQIPSRAGIIPDRPNNSKAAITAENKKSAEATPKKLCGIFADEMPQTILTHVVNYRLSYIQLDGDESPVMVENLRRTLIPDFTSDIKIIKTIHLNSEADIQCAHTYDGLADYFIFKAQDPSLLSLTSSFPTL